jgi:hypothetical protein
MGRLTYLRVIILFASLFALSACAASSSSSMIVNPFAPNSEMDSEYSARDSFGPLPTLSEASIDEAVKRFSIKIPKHIKRPLIDHLLVDRGRTSWNFFGGAILVKLGPPAFTSWGLLGATLAHELEIHCQQNLMAISFKNALGIDAVSAAELEAYNHELSNAERFGLSSEETQRIADTLMALNLNKTK